MTPGQKHDAGKPRFELIPSEPLTNVARVMTHGAEKYGDRNWEKGIVWSRLYGAAMRHLNAFWGGETYDPDTGLPHLAHAACNMLMLMGLDGREDLDDRPKVQHRIDLGNGFSFNPQRVDCSPTPPPPE